MTIFKSILHNLGVVAVSILVAFAGTRLDLLLGIHECYSVTATIVGSLLMAIGFLVRVWATYYFVTAQDARPEALCVSGDTERIYQDFRFLGDGLDDVPALLFGSGDE